jgi:hypothetical protein
LSFFGVRKAAPTHKRPPSVELHPVPAKPPRQDRVETDVIKPAPTVALKPAKPFPFLDLPFELLCEVMARVPPGPRHLPYGGSPLATTCRAFHAAIKAVSTMPPYRDDDAIARRVVGMRTGDQVQPMIDSLVDAKPAMREWAVATVTVMTAGMPESARRDEMIAVLDRAKEHSSLWELELVRHLARWLPDTDSTLLSLLTDRAIQFDAQTDDEHLGKARALAQLAQRISPNDLPGTVRRWESIFTLVSTHPRIEDILTLRGLEAGFDHLRNTFQCKFNVDSGGMLLCRLIQLYRVVDSLEAKRFMAACTAGELALRQPPTPLPGTVKPHDPMRAFTSIMVRPIPTVGPLPSHLM